MRNNTNYMETGVLTALQLTAGFPETVLENFYHKSRTPSNPASKDAPYRLRHSGRASRHDARRVHRQHPAPARHRSGPRHRRNQAQRRHIPGRLSGHQAQPALWAPGQDPARKAKLPDPNLRTYDDSGWTMGLMTHTKIVESADTAVLDIPVEKVDQFEVKGKVAAAGHRGRLRRSRQRLRQHGHPALPPERHLRSSIAEQAFDKVRRVFHHSCRTSVGQDSLREVESLGLTALATHRATTVPMHDADSPSSRRLQHLGQHARRGLGSLCFRSLRNSIRPHL